MLIVEDYDGCFNDPIEKYYGLENFSVDDGEKVFFHGMGCIEKPNYKIKYQNYKKKAFWNLEHPCAWYSNDQYKFSSANVDGYFDKVITICPYTAEWLNQIQGKNTFVFPDSQFPFNKKLVTNKKEEKIYDVIYWGGVHHQDHLDFVDSMTSFNYNFLSLGPEYWNQDYNNSGLAKYITEINLPRKQMWELLRKTKICLISNKLYLNDTHVKSIKSIQKWEQCEAFSHLETRQLPQIKTRMIECAVNRCLMLVKDNPWRVDEYSFESGKDFIYFDKNEELPALIEDISKNWHKYEEMVESAFVKATTRHTVKNLVTQIEKELDD